MAEQVHAGDMGGDGQPPGDRTPPGYPAELEAEALTADGRTLLVRPIRPGDGPALVAFHGRLSPHSVYLRYFGAHPTLSGAEVERFTHVDYDRRLALVVEDGDAIVAVGRYEREEGGDDAEVAFVVADDYQHRGIGTALLDRLALWARLRGITTFTAETLAENRQMLHVFFDSGFRVRSQMESGTVRVRFPIEPDDAYRDALAARYVRVRPVRPGAPGVPGVPAVPAGSTEPGPPC